MDLLEQFRQAGSDGQSFRGAPFWSWNDDLDPDELRRQIREMKRVGLGGHMMHARIGLLTRYLGEDWMECIRAAVDESAEIGMDAWLYDEDCWPSGTAGGRVPAKGEAYRQKWIVVQEIAPEYFQPAEHTIAVFVGSKTEEGWSGLKRLSDPSRAGDEAAQTPGGKILHFSYATGDYVDLLRSEVVADFIKEDYDVYTPIVGEQYGQAVPGVFTDEPQWQHVPWSPDLPGFYAELYGEDLLDALPAVFFPVGDYQQARYRFWNAATRLFVRSFSQQIGEWCEGHGIALTGHYMSEDSLGAQIRNIGAAMPHYEFMRMPGIDHLGRRLPGPLLVKQVSTAGSQFGRRTLTETFGCAGWNVSLEELKWIGEAQFAMGVSFPCAHLSLYSLRGCRKRDYPPSLHYQQPWWPDYRLLNDRWARLLFMLTQGKRVADVLLLHPIASAWAVHDPQDWDAVHAMSRHFEGISKYLLSIHRDHDYGDEILMERHGRVEGNRLHVGQAEYAAVVIPPMVTLQRSTARLLRDFHAAGGKLILIGDGPERLDGEAGPDAEEFRSWLLENAQNCPDDEPEALENALFQVGWPRLQIKDSDGEYAESVLVHHRELGSKQIYFFLNTDQEKAFRADVALQGLGSVQRWDLDSGEISLVPVRQAMGNTAFKLDFSPMQSHLLVLDTEEEPWIGTPGRDSEVGIFYGEEEWSVELLTPNALTLDTARYRVDGGEWSEPTYVLHIQRELAKRGADFDVELEFTFENRLTADPGPLHFVLEQPEEHRIEVNGKPVESKDDGWWTDISFRKIDLTGRLKNGENTITLSRRFIGDPNTAKLIEEKAVHESAGNRLKFGCEIEAVYLLGNFGVAHAGSPEKEPNDSVRVHGPFALVDVPETVSVGNLSTQGFPFFCGTLAIEQEIWIPERPGDDDVRAILELETLNAAVTQVIVNGEAVGKFAWKPYRLDVTDFVPEGENIRLRLELTGSCRNLLGPHHHIDGELHMVGPDSFLGKKGWTDRRDAPDSTWKDGYNVVNFGIEGEVIVLFNVLNEEAPDENLVRRQCG